MKTRYWLPCVAALSAGVAIGGAVALLQHDAGGATNATREGFTECLASIGAAYVYFGQQRGLNTFGVDPEGESTGAPPVYAYFSESEEAEQLARRNLEKIRRRVGGRIEVHGRVVYVFTGDISNSQRDHLIECAEYSS